MLEVEFGRSVSKDIGINNQKEQLYYCIYELLMCSNKKCIFWVFTWVHTVFLLRTFVYVIDFVKPHN